MASEQEEYELYVRCCVEMGWTPATKDRFIEFGKAFQRSHPPGSMAQLAPEHESIVNEITETIKAITRRA